MSDPIAVSRRLVAVFAADVEGYSRLMGADEVGTLKGLTERRAILDRFIGEHRGKDARGTRGARVSRAEAVEKPREVQMDSILSWLTKYSPPVVLLLAVGGVFLFVSKQVTESAISAQFEQYKKEVELRLQRRSNFEERVLLDRYVLLREIHSKIGRVVTELNRSKSGTTVKGLIHDGDIVPLTSVVELIEQDRYLITERFREILLSQVELLIKYANTQDAHVMEKQLSEYLERDKAFDQAMNEVFGLDKITWERRD